MIKSTLIKPHAIRKRLKELNRRLKPTLGSLILLDRYVDAILKRAAATDPSRWCLDAPAMLVSCEHPFHFTEETR